MFNNYLSSNSRETPLPSLENQDRGNHVFSIPNISSLSRSSSSRPVSISSPGLDGDDVFPTPNMSSLSRSRSSRPVSISSPRRPVDDDVFATSDSSSLSRSRSSRPVPTIDSARPVDDYDFANFDINPFNSAKRYASWSYIQPNQNQLGNTRRAYSCSANHHFMGGKNKSADADSLTNPKVCDTEP